VDGFGLILFCGAILHLPGRAELRHEHFLRYIRYLFGFLAFLWFLVMSEELARCTKPQPGGPGDFWSKVFFL
jgi:hypothetical protein